MIGEFCIVILDFLLELFALGAFDERLQRRKQEREMARTTSYWDREPTA